MSALPCRPAVDFPLQREKGENAGLSSWKEGAAMGLLPVLSCPYANSISCGLTKSLFSDKMLPLRQFETILSKNKTMEN